jgi:hypothetical protein
MNKLKLSLVASLFTVAITPLVGNAAVIGFLGNFDVINDTGSTAHGFEIDLEGLHLSDITDTFGGAGRGFPTGRGFGAGSVERYGSPTLVEYTNGATFGTKVVYEGLYDSVTKSWDYGTPSGTQVTPGDNCWSGGGIGYSASTACDHFGVGTSKNASKTTYSWLLETATPGVLSNGVVNLPTPTYQVIPAPVVANQPAAAPQVVAQVQAPLNEVNTEFGDATWVKVFTTELDHAVALEELIGGNQVIDQAKSEVEWQLLQYDSGKGAFGAGNGQLELGLAAPVGPNAASIIRRYEFYKFGGAYDLETHEALLTGTDSKPGEGDVGSYMGAQNGAVNLVANIAAVPEPSEALLFATGLITLLGFARKRNLI